MIDVSHWLGALSGVVGTIGRVDTPTRRLVDHAAAQIPTPVTLVSMVVVDDARLAGCRERVVAAYQLTDGDVPPRPATRILEIIR